MGANITIDAYNHLITVNLLLSYPLLKEKRAIAKHRKKKELENRILQATRSVEKSAVVHRVVIQSDLVSFLVDAWALSFTT